MMAFLSNTAREFLANQPDPPRPTHEEQREWLKRVRRMNKITFTDHELALLADSVFWEMEFLGRAQWLDTPRSKTLQAIQDRIHNYLDSSGYYKDRADLV